MGRAQWPKLCQEPPADLKEHAASLAKDFQAIQDFASTSVSNVAPSLPKGIEHKIMKGIQKGLVDTESLNGCFTSLSSAEQNLTINTIVKKVTSETAAVFHKRISQYLFDVLHDSYKELYHKLGTQLDTTSAHVGGVAEMASGNEILPHTPPHSPLEDTDPEMLTGYGSDTSGRAHYDRDLSMIPLNSRARKLEADLQEVDRQRKALNERLDDKATKIKAHMQNVVRGRRAVNETHDKIIEAMILRRIERERTGDYSTCTVVYDPLDFDHAKRQDNARSVLLRIEKQAAVNRIFNMPSGVLMQKVRDVVSQRNQPGPDGSAYSSINLFLGAELVIDGNVLLWAESTDDYDRQNSEGDMFDGLRDVPLWDHDLFTGVARHVAEPHKPFEVEMKHVTADMINIKFRKEKAAMITELVKQNVIFIPCLHIDVFKDIHFSRSTTDDKAQALVLEFSDPSVANEVMASGLQWQERYHACEVFDNQFFDQCGHCQTYGHHAQACTGPLRCGQCAEEHLTELCESSLTKCASCNRRHKFASSKCHAKRILDKCYARFSTAEDSPTLARRYEEREDLNTSSDSVAANPGGLQKKKTPPKLAPAQARARTEASGKPTLSPQQLHDGNRTIEYALRSNNPAKRGLTPTIEGFEPAQEPRIETKRRLTSWELERRRGISEDPVQEPGVEKKRKLTSKELEKRKGSSKDPAQDTRIEKRRGDPAQDLRIEKRRKLTSEGLEKSRGVSKDPTLDPSVEKKSELTLGEMTERARMISEDLIKMMGVSQGLTPV